MNRAVRMLYCSLNVFILAFGLSNGETAEHVIARSKAIRDYLTLCTSTNICIIKPEGIPQTLRCCDSCDCSVGCGHNCCPDGPQTYLTKEEIELLKRNDIVKCIKPSMKGDLLSSIHPMYEMTTDCPYDYGNATIRETCQRPFEEFALGDNVWNVPVTTNSTRKTYKNLYCAMCNDAEMEDSVVWDVVMSCMTMPVIGGVNYLRGNNITSASDIPRYLPDICNIVYRKPALSVFRSQDDDGIATCPGLIDRCNVTGEWEGGPAPNDFHTETACLSYLSAYNGYRNIHCYLCNGGNFSYPDDGCWQQQFGFPTTETTLMIRNALETTEQRCQFGFIFDNFTDTCRQLHCPKGFVLKGTLCVSFLQDEFDEFFYHVYDVTMTFEPESSSLTQKVSFMNINDLFKIVEESVITKLQENKGAETVRVCDHFQFVKFRQSPNDLVSSLRGESRDVLFYDIMYIAFTFRVLIEDVNNVTQAIEDMLSLYNSTVIETEGNSFVPGSRIIDPDLINVVMRHEQDYTAICEDTVRSLRLVTLMEQTFKRSLVDPSDGFMVGPLGTNPVTSECASVAIVEANTFCPKLELGQDEFVREGDGVRIKNINSFVSRDDGHFGSGWNTFRICSESYTKVLKAGLGGVTGGTGFLSFSLCNIYVYVAGILWAFA